MYSNKIDDKINIIFSNLKVQADTVIEDATSIDEGISIVTNLVSSELVTNSRSILRDMIFELSSQLLKTEFFEDIERQNKFYEMNLRQEILNKYQFSPNTDVQFKSSLGSGHSIMVGGAAIFIGGVAEVGTVLIKGLSISSLFPIPVGALLFASIGIALMDYYILGPKRTKASLVQTLTQYLCEIKIQLLSWFDEVEKYFYMRVEELKQAM